MSRTESPRQAMARLALEYRCHWCGAGPGQDCERTNRETGARTSLRSPHDARFAVARSEYLASDVGRQHLAAWDAVHPMPRVG